MSSLPPPIPAAARANPFARQAASFSVLAPFVGMGINIFGSQSVQGNRVGMMVLGGTCTLLILAGLGLGVVALIGTKKHGTQGILGKAIAGVCINGILIGFMVIGMFGFIKAAERAKEKQQQGIVQQSPQP
jgi:hypothetical protein